MPVTLLALQHTENEHVAQRRYAAVLREMAIAHLRKSTKPVAHAFRAESETAAINCEAFLEKQAMPGVWGTYVELAALGELFGVTIQVTVIAGDKIEPPFNLYKAKKSDATVLHFYNSNNTHWHYHPEGFKTIGDGNCLYNAFAQAGFFLKDKVSPVINRVATPGEKKKNSVIVKQGLFGDIASIKRHQAEILSTLKINRKNTEHRSLKKQEMVRMKNLSKSEQQQIASDYVLALQLASEEMPRVGLKK